MMRVFVEEVGYAYCGGAGLAHRTGEAVSDVNIVDLIGVVLDSTLDKSKRGRDR